MRCQRIQHLYEEYTRGTLSVGALARIDEHLGGCPACRQEYELNDKIAEALRGTGEVAHPGADYFEALSARVIDRLDDPATIPLTPPPPTAGGHAFWRQPIWWMGGLSAAALVALGLFGPTRRDALAIAAAETHASPSVVVSDTRREIVLGAGLEPTASQPTVISPSARATEKMSDAINRMASVLEAGLRATPPAAPPPSATPAPVVRSVAMRPAILPASGTLPQDLAEQFEAIREEMTAHGDANLTQRLRELESSIAQRPNREALDAQPLVRQARHYLKAQEELMGGRAQEAATLCRRILLIDEKTPLAVRASLQLADLYHNQWADFAEARSYYEKCQVRGAEQALMQPEREHVARQLDRLQAHARDNWEALRLLHRVQQGSWPESQSALRRLVSLKDSGDLLPEAARSVVDRVKAGPGAPSDVAIDIYKVLESRAASEENGSVRAWLELALGDLQRVQFQRLQDAMAHYNKAIALGGDSGAAALAASQRDQLNNRLLLMDQVR